MRCFGFVFETGCDNLLVNQLLEDYRVASNMIRWCTWILLHIALPLVVSAVIVTIIALLSLRNTTPIACSWHCQAAYTIRSIGSCNYSQLGWF